MKPSEQYLAALADATRHHAEHKTYSGKFLRPHAPVIKEMVDRLGCKTILDYGCGKGEQYTWRNADQTGSIPVGMTIEEYWGVPVTKFDPAYPPFAAEPMGKFDLVICTHVLGSIPVLDLPWVVDRLYSLSNKALYIAEKIAPVKKKVFQKPDLHPFGWSATRWMTAIKREKPIEVVLSVREKRADGVFVERFNL
ncbi:methyltransferase domain-containing protein [Mesorhizobium sp.]|uniref:methyltransferase domain-containing protein n=1 Tax=Mesorhizobium sp. TaxID=1871066 RepID=UPI00121E3D11|nr:methyltransferase domain-containing protein [Mesorhizobium sp.]TIX28907.1 MAG: class I SAM-dependent methyltransferase [Mesorhizobium sp.]